jgi:hypothetical protein
MLEAALRGTGVLVGYEKGLRKLISRGNSFLFWRTSLFPHGKCIYCTTLLGLTKTGIKFLLTNCMNILANYSGKP